MASWPRACSARCISLTSEFSVRVRGELPEQALQGVLEGMLDSGETWRSKAARRAAAKARIAGTRSRRAAAVARTCASCSSARARS